MNLTKDVKILNINNKKYYKDIKYPRIPLSTDDIYVITTIGDRFDLLSLDYYGDPSLWKIISTANESLPQNSIYPPVGVQIRIPSNYSEILINFKTLNNP